MLALRGLTAAAREEANLAGPASVAAAVRARAPEQRRLGHAFYCSTLLLRAVRGAPRCSRCAILCCRPRWQRRLCAHAVSAGHDVASLASAFLSPE